MAWTCSSTKKMERLLKAINKKSPALHQALQQHLSEITEDPTIGHLLKGDLQGFMSHDFSFRQVSIRICYVVYEDDDHVTFVYVGTRENFYRDVKNYLFS